MSRAWRDQASLAEIERSSASASSARSCVVEQEREQAPWRRCSGDWRSARPGRARSAAPRAASARGRRQSRSAPRSRLRRACRSRSRSTCAPGSGPGPGRRDPHPVDHRQRPRLVACRQKASAKARRSRFSRLPRGRDRALGERVGLGRAAELEQDQRPFLRAQRRQQAAGRDLVDSRKRGVEVAALRGRPGGHQRGKEVEAAAVPLGCEPGQGALAACCGATPARRGAAWHRWSAGPAGPAWSGRARDPSGRRRSLRSSALRARSGWSGCASASVASSAAARAWSPVIDAARAWR